jgi:hypothetical protein
VHGLLLLVGVAISHKQKSFFGCKVVMSAAKQVRQVVWEKLGRFDSGTKGR